MVLTSDVVRRMFLRADRDTTEGFFAKLDATLEGPHLRCAVGRTFDDMQCESVAFVGYCTTQQVFQITVNASWLHEHKQSAFLSRVHTKVPWHGQLTLLMLVDILWNALGILLHNYMRHGPSTQVAYKTRSQAYRLLKAWREETMHHHKTGLVLFPTIMHRAAVCSG